MDIEAFSTVPALAAALAADDLAHPGQAGSPLRDRVQAARAAARRAALAAGDLSTPAARTATWAAVRAAVVAADEAIAAELEQS